MAYDMSLKWSPFCNKNLDTREQWFLQHQHSSDFLMAEVHKALALKRNLSVIRMGDGEAAFIKAVKHNQLTGECSAPAWLEKMGLTGIDPIALGRDLLQAGTTTDYLGITSWGVYNPSFALHNSFPRQQNYVSAFYPLEWWVSGHVGGLLRAAKYAIIHPQAKLMDAYMCTRFGTTAAATHELANHRGLPEATEFVKASGCKLILGAFGPAGKPWAVKTARLGYIVLDIGHALERCWANPTMEHKL